MNSKRLALLGAVLCAAVMAVPQTAAQASPINHERSSPVNHERSSPINHDVAPTSAAAAADGHLYSYNEINYGSYCASWAGDSSNWGSCQDRSSSLWNNGFPGAYDDVWVFEGINYTGARRGLYQGAEIPNNAAYTFDGTSLSLNDNISSHHWTNL
ncbi:hypothetical protein [Streptomyces sp. NPDC059209]|uniref:hypothetical protein n=1 Tax=Streptomyces sp. NPDC059209 TaxID=3346769 RepID=UPI0036C8D514